MLWAFLAGGFFGLAWFLLVQLIIVMFLFTFSWLWQLSDLAPFPSYYSREIGTILATIIYIVIVHVTASQISFLFISGWVAAFILDWLFHRDQYKEHIVQTYIALRTRRRS